MNVLLRTLLMRLLCKTLYEGRENHYDNIIMVLSSDSDGISVQGIAKGEITQSI